MKITKARLRQLIKEEISRAQVGITPESMIAQYKEDSWAWKRARNDYYNFAIGDDPDGIKDRYYPGWTNQDFIDVITAVDGSYEEY